MPSLLRPRLSCFYCGSRSPHVKDGKTRQFTCQNCEATNHLDHKGEITDPPTTPSKPQTQSFAHARHKSASPTTNISSDNLFCKTCLKNQHFLTTCLAEYLPSEDDPDYEKYERQYPQYRKDLERRYPQVCPQCAPKAQDRIRKTGYAAKVDFFNRNIERSKAHPVTPVSTAVQLADAVLKLLTLAWWMSMLIQALWHTFGLTAMPQDPEHVANMRPLMLIGCSVTAFNAHFLPAGCSHLLTDMVRQSLQLTLLLAWWNPALKKKLRSPGRNYRWVGLGDFYRFQVVIYLIRLTAWWKLGHSGTLNFSPDMTRGLHGLALLSIIIGALASQRMVDYIPAPKFSFKDTTGSLIDPDGFQYPADTLGSQPSLQPPVSSIREPLSKSFNIASLGPRRPLADKTQHFSPNNSFMAPEMSPDHIDHSEPADVMDWEPLPRQSSPMIRRTHNPTMTSTFQQRPESAPAVPAFLRAPATASAGEKSPFTGRLPPAPISPAHRLRNPPPRPQFKPTPLSKQQNFFQQMGLSSATADKNRPRPSSDGESDDAQENAGTQTYISTDKENDPFRPAQWTLRSDLDAAARGTGTGLEDMFSSSFKLGDETPAQTPRKSRRRREVGGDGREVFERAQMQTTAAAKMVGGSLQTLVLPVILALLAIIFAIARDPSGRQWMVERLEDVLWHVKPHFGHQGAGNAGTSPGILNAPDM